MCIHLHESFGGQVKAKIMHKKVLYSIAKKGTLSGCQILLFKLKLITDRRIKDGQRYPDPASLKKPIKRINKRISFAPKLKPKNKKIKNESTSKRGKNDKKF